MDFHFEYPIGMTALDGTIRVVERVEMLAEIDFADPRDQDDYGIVALYTRDQDKPIKQDWFQVNPTTEGFRLAVEWIKNNPKLRERLEHEWDEHCTTEGLTPKPLVHEHSTYVGRPS